METKTNSYIRKLVVTGAVGALTVFLSMTKLGLIPWFTGASITIIHIPVIIAAILEGPIVGIGVGAIFGLFSLIQAISAPAGPIDVAFANPLVSVIPRMLFPIAAWGLYALLSNWKKVPAIVIASVVATVVHTTLVLGMLVATNGSGLLTGNAEGVTVWTVIGAIFLANGIPEAIAAGILSPLVIMAWLGIGSGRKKSKLTGEQ